MENGLIRTEYLQTNEMPADILTKALGANKHYKFIKMLGLDLFFIFKRFYLA